MTTIHHVALFAGPIIGEASTEAEAIALACPSGVALNVDFYDAEDGPGAQGYAPDGRGVWIIDPDDCA